VKNRGLFRAPHNELQNRLETLDPGPGWLRARFIAREQIQDRNKWLLDNPHLPGYLWRGGIERKAAQGSLMTVDSIQSKGSIVQRQPYRISVSYKD
jgi:hypothetical protein